MVGVVVVVVVDDVVVVDAGSVVVVVVVDGDGAVVVVVDEPPDPVVTDAGLKVHMAEAQSGGDARTTSTPGRVENVQTFRAGPLSRQVSAGSVVVKWLMVPWYTAVPSEAGGATGDNASFVPSHTPEDTKPEPTGAAGAGVDELLVLVGPGVRSSARKT